MTTYFSSRNGGGIEESPWCYTMDPLVRWQHCHVPRCGKYLCTHFILWSDGNTVMFLDVVSVYLHTLSFSQMATLSYSHMWYVSMTYFSL